MKRPQAAPRPRRGRRERLFGLFAFEAFFIELSVLAFGLFLPYLMTAHGHLDWAGHAIGRDFINFWTAGQLMFGPRLEDIFEPARFLAWERRLFDPRLPFHFWSYPPPALLLCAPLALFAYLPGLAAWTAAGLIALLPAARAFIGRRDLWLVMASPAVAVNIALGQNGAFTAALLFGGWALMRRRPYAAGALWGLLIFKPQLAILLPLAVLGLRSGRALIGGALSATAVLALSLVLFGAAAWRGFFGSTLAAQTIMLSHGHGPFQWMMPSVFMAARSMGAPAAQALAMQVPFILLAFVMTWRALRGGADDEVKAAVLFTATFLATPQAFNYDLIPTAAAALILRRRDPSMTGRLTGLLLFAAPLLLLAAEVVHVPIGPPILIAALVRLCALRAPGARVRWRDALSAPPSRETGERTHSEAA